MGGRRLSGSNGDDSGNDRKGIQTPPLLDRIASPTTHIAAGDLFALVCAYCEEKSSQRDMLKHAERAIRTIYSRYSPDERAQFFAMLYDKFSDRYDEHMETTGHFPAIRRILPFALPHIRAPMLDITAGSGEALGYALDFMRDGRAMAGTSLGCLAPGNGMPTALSHAFFANEISTRMLAIAEMKLAGRGIGFLNADAMGLPGDFHGRFATVLCSQTFHLISDEDKARLAISIREALMPGGKAIVMEEDPFRITETPQIEPVSMFLRAVVRPIKYPEKLAAYFIQNGFTRLEETAAAPIDSEHIMRLHIFARD